MTSPWKKQPEVVMDKVLKRAEVSKIVRKLQDQLALAQFKTKHGWEDLPLDSIESKYEEEIRRKRLAENAADGLSDSSSSTTTSDHLPYPSALLSRHHNHLSSPLKAPFYSDAIGSSNRSTSHRKRTYIDSFDHEFPSPAKRRYRSSPTPSKYNNPFLPTYSHQLTQSSPIKPKRHQHFTTATGPDVSLFQSSRKTSIGDLAATAASNSDSDGDDLLPSHSFHVGSASIVQSSPPRTPVSRNKTLGPKQSKENGGEAKSGQEGADLLLYLAQSPSPAVTVKKITTMEPPSTPPPKHLALPSSMMTTPGGGNLFPNTPGQGLDFSEFLKFTPSPARFKTPGAVSATRTPLASSARRRLTFDEPLA